MGISDDKLIYTATLILIFQNPIHTSLLLLFLENIVVIALLMEMVNATLHLCIPSGGGWWLLMVRATQSMLMAKHSDTHHESK